MTPLNLAYWAAAVWAVYRLAVYLRHVFKEGHHR